MLSRFANCLTLILEGFLGYKLFYFITYVRNMFNLLKINIPPQRVAANNKISWGGARGPEIFKRRPKAHYSNAIYIVMSPKNGGQVFSKGGYGSTWRRPSGSAAHSLIIFQVYFRPKTVGLWLHLKKIIQVIEIKLFFAFFFKLERHSRYTYNVVLHFTS